MPRKLSKGRNSLSSARPSPSSVPSPYTDQSLAPWMHDSLPLPRLVVLDLDYTLWPFYSDICVHTPVRPVPSSNHTRLADRFGEEFCLVDDAPHILGLLSHLGIRLAVASKSPVGDLCREMLKLLRLPDISHHPQQHPNNNNTTTTHSKTSGGGGGGIFGSGGQGAARRAIDVFDGGLEIYEGTKLRHFEEIARRTRIPYTDMLFFDDEPPNFEVQSLGVTMRLVGNKGLTWGELEKGIEKWRGNRGT